MVLFIIYCYIELLISLQMNEIILKRIYNKQQSKLQLDALTSKKRNLTLKSAAFHRINMLQQPNLQLNMLRKDRLSQKRYMQGSKRYYDLERELIQHSEIPDSKNIKQNINEEQQKKDGQKSLYQKGNDIKNMGILKYSKMYSNDRKIKDLKQQLNKINAPTLNHQNRSNQSINRRQFQNLQKNNINNLCKSESCKSRPMRFNPEILLDNKKNQCHDINKKIIFKMSRDKNKHLYEQAMSHLFELTKNKILQTKIKSQMPSQLDVKEIIIPKIRNRYEWKDKINKKNVSINKMQQNLLNRKKASSLKIPTGSRSKTDSKLSNRNDTNILQNNGFWIDLIENTFEPWQNQTFTSKFYD